MKERMDRMEEQVSTLRNQNKDLFGRVKLLEKTLSNRHRHQMKKRQISKINPTVTNKYCASAANLCTFFYPDHPDQIGKNKTSSGPSKVTISSRKTNEAPAFSSKMPENCKDLQFSGHTLNGFYLVQKGEGITKQIGTIFCQFIQEQSSESEDIQRKF